MEIGSKSSIKIESDFNDYYDELSDNESDLIYKRFRKESMSRVKALKKLSELSIATLELKPVSKFLKQEFPLVVYTDIKAHDGIGKRIVTYEEAMNYYSNYIASRYIEPDNNCSIKYIQLGKRRFTIKFELNEPLKIGGVTDIKESEQQYNDKIDIPIYSIDYIENNGKLIATDFNEVENFKKCGLTNFIPAEHIIRELYNYFNILRRQDRWHLI